MEEFLTTLFMKPEAAYVDQDGNPEIVNLFPGINSPGPDLLCDCCRREFDQLPEYGGPGDPLVGDFRHARLVKVYRRTIPGYDQVGSTWLCRGCVVLDYEEYFARIDSAEQSVRREGFRGEE